MSEFLKWVVREGNHSEYKPVNVCIKDYDKDRWNYVWKRITNYVDPSVPVNYYGSNNYGSKLDCTSGVIRFNGTIDSVNRDIILKAGESVGFDHQLNGTIYYLLNQEDFGVFECGDYKCTMLAASYTISERLKQVDPDPMPEAYQIWLDDGFEGSEDDFLAWLSVQSPEVVNEYYQIWLNNGFEGSEGDFVEWLTEQTPVNKYYAAWIADGFEGSEDDFLAWISEQSPDNKYYQAWLDNGFEGTEEEFYEWLTNQSPTTQEAYDVWINNGFEGTEEEFLAWLAEQFPEEPVQPEPDPEPEDPTPEEPSEDEPEE